MFNRSQIMKAAWTRYRDIHARYGAWQIKRGIVDGSFAHALRCAWSDAKAVAAKEAAKARLDAAMAGPDGERIARVRFEIETLSCKPWRIDIEAMRRTLETELKSLAA